MNETTFENAKPGDKVSDIIYGDGVVLILLTNPHDPYPLIVKFNGVPEACFTLDGKLDLRHNRTLFWAPVEIVAPPRPKRKVKKVIEQWINIYDDECFDRFSTQEDAILGAEKDCIAVAIHTPIEYEVEE